MEKCCGLKVESIHYVILTMGVEKVVAEEDAGMTKSVANNK